MESFKLLSNKLLLEAYAKAISMGDNADFVYLLKKEISRRNIDVIPNNKIKHSN